MPPSALDKYIAATFAKAKVRFHHAENLRNFSTYCSAKALLSRTELMRRDPYRYTRFYSDRDDERLGALSRVFGNIYDFGAVFARGRNTVPNIYGPITLVFKPSVFAEMTDIAITSRSIATHLDEWDSERVRERSVVDEIVAGDDYGSPVAHGWQGCELSCEGPLLSFASLDRIVVEPLSIEGKPLLDYVREVGADLGVPIRSRHYSLDGNRAKLQDLVDACVALDDNIALESWSFHEDALPESWSEFSETKRRRVPGWCQYFYYGTLGECRFRAWLDELDDADDRTRCEMCDPGEDRPSPLVNYRPLYGGAPGSGPLDVGRCDWCSGISVRCRQCDVVHPIYEHQYDEVIVCGGGCGLRFTVEESRDHDGSYEVVVIGEGEDFEDDQFEQ